MRNILFTLLAIAFPAGAWAQTGGYGTEKDMPLFYQQLKEQLTFPWAWQAKRASMDFNTWREEARRQVEATMQMAPPPPASYDYEVVAREQRDGYEAQKIVFSVNKWEKTMAYLLVPKAKKAPALLMLHDHGAHFSIGKEKMVRPFGVDSTLMEDAEDWVARC